MDFKISDYGLSKVTKLVIFEKLWLSDSKNTLFHLNDVIDISFFLFFYSIQILCAIFLQVIKQINVFESYNFDDLICVLKLVMPLSMITRGLSYRIRIIKSIHLTCTTSQMTGLCQFTIHDPTIHGSYINYANMRTFYRYTS